MLNSVTHKEEYNVIGNDLYAVLPTGEKRDANEDGCELMKKTLADINACDEQIAEQYKIIEQLEIQKQGCRKLVGELSGCGFCAIDRHIVKRHPENGMIVESYLGHQRHCRNKPKKGE